MLDRACKYLLTLMLFNFKTSSFEKAAILNDVGLRSCYRSLHAEKGYFSCNSLLPRELSASPLKIRTIPIIKK